jgi:acetyl-CoA acetyltransferase
MDVFVMGLAVHPPAARVAGKRLEEMVFDTARAALDDAGVTRAEIDHVTIAGCDELDGRSISSMLMAAPSGALLKDEVKCTDSGLTGFCLGTMKVESEVVDLGLVVSWSKPSTAPVEDVMRMRCEPFYTRPVGLNMAIADGLFAQGLGDAYGIGEDDANAAVIDACRRAVRNPRGMGRAVPPEGEIAGSPYLATPLRAGHQAPITDGAVAMVLASAKWLAGNPRARPLARVAGIGWRNEEYDLGRERLTGLAGFRAAIADAAAMAGLDGAGDLDLLELDCQTGWHALAYEAALGRDPPRLTPSGGAFAQNPYFCTGLVNAAEAVLQVSDRAGPIQIAGASLAGAHGSHGFAQQAHVVAIFERV